MCLALLALGCTRENPGFGVSASTSAGSSTSDNPSDTSDATNITGSESDSQATSGPTTDEPTDSATTIDPSDSDSTIAPTTIEPTTTDGETTDGETTEAETTEGDTENGDSDNDGLPDACDPFPDDGDRPGALAATQTLYLVAEKEMHIVKVGDPPMSMGVVPLVDADTQIDLDVRELAVDECRVMIATTQAEVYACDASNGNCWYLTSVGKEPQGLAAVPGIFLDMPDSPIMLGANLGTWYSLDLAFDPAHQGAGYDMLSFYVMSGDIAWMQEAGLFATVNPGTNNYDLQDAILLLDPIGEDMLLIEHVSPAYKRLRGLAAIDNNLYALNSNGAVLKFTYTNGTLVASDPLVYYTAEGDNFVGAAAVP